MEIILASASPRRQELLKNIFPSFHVHASSCEEAALFETPSQYVMELANMKAADVAAHYTEKQFSDSAEDFLIIGADTIVYSNGTVLGKPSDRDDAYQMLKSISGKIHEVYTGFSLIHITGTAKKTYTSYTCTRVHVQTLSDQEIFDYIDGPENVYDKAGSYAIQGMFGRHIRGIEGDYFNVVGLPICSIYQMLKTHKLL